MNTTELEARLDVVVKFLQRQGSKSTVPVSGCGRVYRIADLIEAVDQVKAPFACKNQKSNRSEDYGQV